MRLGLLPFGEGLGQAFRFFRTLAQVVRKLLGTLLLGPQTNLQRFALAAFGLFAFPGFALRHGVQLNFFAGQADFVNTLLKLRRQVLDPPLRLQELSLGLIPRLLFGRGARFLFRGHAFAFGGMLGGQGFGVFPGLGEFAIPLAQGFVEFPALLFGRFGPVLRLAPCRLFGLEPLLGLLLQLRAGLLLLPQLAVGFFARGLGGRLALLQLALQFAHPVAGGPDPFLGGFAGFLLRRRPRLPVGFDRIATGRLFAGQAFRLFPGQARGFFLPGQLLLQLFLPGCRFTLQVGKFLAGHPGRDVPLLDLLIHPGAGFLFLA